MRTEWLKACETSRKRAKHTSPFLIPYIEAVDEDIAWRKKNIKNLINCEERKIKQKDLNAAYVITVIQDMGKKDVFFL